MGPRTESLAVQQPNTSKFESTLSIVNIFYLMGSPTSADKCYKINELNIYALTSVQIFYTVIQLYSIVVSFCNNNY